MKIEKNFTTGVLSGICGILVVLVIMGSTTPETTTKFEFHDLGDTRGVIFNKVTGEMDFKEIRTEPLNTSTQSLQSIQHIRLSDWNGLSGDKLRVDWTNPNSN
jgi:lantibiotic modifying enzyme